MLLGVPINRAKCICEILRKNVKDAHTLWKHLYTKGFQRWETLVYNNVEKQRERELKAVDFGEALVL